MNATIMTGAAMRPYKLVSYNCYSAELRTELFTSLDELAYAAYRASWYLKDNARKWFVSETYAVEQCAFAPRGKPLAIAELVAWGGRLAWNKYVLDTLSAYTHRQGPVRGIRKWRGGSSSRPHQVQGQRRANALVLVEDGEVPARVSRCGFNLPDSWDGRRRINQRCWKSQHKGRKSWDRPAQHGKKQ
jgi:hypothetical protein